MNKELKLSNPWPVSFDEANGVWTISGYDDKGIFPLATISCRADAHNGQRRHAAHLMANAERMYRYVNSMADVGDNRACALVDAIQVSMTAKDAEERAMQSTSLNPC